MAKIKHAEINHAKKKERENFPIYGINYLIISVIIKNVERASTARVREFRDFHVRGTEPDPNDV